MGTVASAMTMRATVRRPGVGAGAWNTPGAPVALDSPVRCAVWQLSASEQRGSAIGATRDVVLGDYRMLAAQDAVHAGDLVDFVADRRGDVLFTGLRVQSVSRRPDGYADVVLEDA